MANNVTTTITVKFGSGNGAGTGHLSAEIDNRPDGLNIGKSSFLPGDPVHILVYKSSNVTIDQVIASIGNAIFSDPDQTVEITEDLVFENSRDAALNKPAYGPLTVQWFGNTLGNLAVSDDQVTVTANQAGVAIAKVTYSTKAKAYRLSTPLTLNGEKSYSVLVVISGRAA